MNPEDKSRAAAPSELVVMLERRLNAERAERKRLQALLARADKRLAGDPDAAGLRLDRLIAQRTRALSAARDEAVAASKAKSSFLANMSHEIRTPLTSIIGFAELLQDPRAGVADKDDAARTIVRNGRHLLEVINDILDMSKIESNQLTVEKIEVGLPRLLSDLQALAAGRAQEKSLQFTITHRLPLPPVLRTDPVRLKQILLNFCSNAIKFSHDGQVRLTVSFDTGTQSIRFDVTDSGIGMTEAELKTLFKPFAQADISTTRKFGGTGLGLYISRQLADMLGGAIHVQSEPGQGSCFSLTLPLGIGAQDRRMLDDERDFDDVGRPVFQITAVDIPQLSGRVLVAEDGLDNQRLLASYLRQAGVDFDIVRNGREAVAKALGHEYALVLMDIQMPVMDGVSATKKLRESNYRGPIVALTANVMHEDVKLYKSSGCTSVLAKPIDRTSFYAVLKTHVPELGAPSAADTDEYAQELAALTDEFAAGLPAVFAQIHDAVERADGPALKALLHSLKGTAGNYGFLELARLATEAECLLAAGQVERVRSTCRGFAASVPPRSARSRAGQA